MSNKIDHFWEIFKAVAGDSSANVTKTTDAFAKSDRAKVESYFSSVIDQYTFETIDYNRLRKFLIDLYATHRTKATISLSSSDPRVLTNSDLDELFRSFGYPLSAPLRSYDENALPQKVNFFLDLISLYKVKGTPQSLVDLLQYYGVTRVDIYEFFIKKYTTNSLIFNGKAVAGTTLNPTDLILDYNSIVNTDPHWLYTQSQILNLFNRNQINLPSKTPYFGVQPIVDLEGSEISIISRHIQDQYDYYLNTGNLPSATAEITYIGESRSILELYLACVYTFNKLYDTGTETVPIFNTLYSPNDIGENPWKIGFFTTVTDGYETHEGNFNAQKLEDLEKGVTNLVSNDLTQLPWWGNTVSIGHELNSFKIEENSEIQYHLRVFDFSTSSQHYSDHVIGAITFSAYVKADENNHIWMGIRNYPGIFKGAFFNLTNGSSFTTSGDGVYFSINHVGNGWYYCSVTTNVLYGYGWYDFPNVNFCLVDDDGVSLAYQGNTGDGVLIHSVSVFEEKNILMWPSLLTNKPPWQGNLILYSGYEDYLGTNNAFKATEKNTVISQVYRNEFPGYDNHNYTISGFFKAVERTEFVFSLGRKNGTLCEASFNLLIGVRIGTSDAITTIIKHPNGWYYITLTGNVSTGNSIPKWEIKLRHNNTTTYAGTLNYGILISEPMVREHYYHEIYQTFNLAPKLNILKSVDDLSISPPWMNPDINLTSGHQTYFETNEAFKLEETGAEVWQSIWQEFDVDDNQTVTISAFFKAAERSQVDLYFYRKDGNAYGAKYDLTNGTKIGGGPSAIVEAYPDDWYRISITGNVLSGDYPTSFLVMISAGNNSYYTGTAGYGILIYKPLIEKHIQLEPDIQVTFSAFVKAQERSTGEIIIAGQSTTGASSGFFDLKEEKITTVWGSGESSIQKHNHGWYRISLKTTAGLGTEDTLRAVLRMTKDKESPYIGEQGFGLLIYKPILNIGSLPEESFVCYDGILTDPSKIIEEFNIITQGPFSSRIEIKDSYNEYLELFSRKRIENFLQSRSTAGETLSIISSDIKTSIDNATDLTNVLYSLLKDLSFWVRNNIGFGFVDFGFILFGIQEFFKDLIPVINFFKPYRARMLLIESLQIKNRLFNSFLIEDDTSIDVKVDLHDFITSNSIPCCQVDDSPCENYWTICKRVPLGSQSNYTWVGIWENEVEYKQNDVVVSGNENQYFICIQNHTSSEDHKPLTGILWENKWELYSQITCTYANIKYAMPIPPGSTSLKINLPEIYPNINYSIACSLEFDQSKDLSAINAEYGFVIKEKTVSSFTVLFSSPILNNCYQLNWYTDNSINSKRISLTSGIDSITIPLSMPTTDYIISGSLRTSDEIPEVYGFVIADKTTSNFKVVFSSPISSNNYIFDYFVDINDKQGIAPIIFYNETVNVTFDVPLLHDRYPLLTTIESNNTSIFFSSITNKTNYGFTVTLSSPPQDLSGVYKLEWAIPTIEFPPSIDYHSRETFDCGSYFDIGSVTDIVTEPHIYIEDKFTELLKCPNITTTGYIVSEIINMGSEGVYSKQIPANSKDITINTKEEYPNTDYGISVNVRFDRNINILNNLQHFNCIITDKTTKDFKVLFSDTIPNNNYFLDWFTVDSTNAGSVSLIEGNSSHVINLVSSCSDYMVSGALRTTDSTSSIYGFKVTEINPTNFEVTFPLPIDSTNYFFDYFICSSIKEGRQEVPINNDLVIVDYETPMEHNTYPLLVTIEDLNNNGFITATIVSKSNYGNTIKLSDAVIDSTSLYNLTWVIPNDQKSDFSEYLFHQSGEFRDFDTEGKFDCSHGFDSLFIKSEDRDLSGLFIIQEDENYILQENGYRILF